MDNFLYLFEDIAEPFWVIDESFRLVYANKAFHLMSEALYGTTIKKGDILLSQVENNDRNCFWSNCYKQAFATDHFTIAIDKRELPFSQKILIDCRLISLPMKLLCIKAIASPEIKDSLFGINHQVNIKRETGDELESLIALLDDVILVVNNRFEIVRVWCNDPAKLPFSQELMIGKTIRQVKGEELGKQFEDHLTKLFNEGVLDTFEYSEKNGDLINWYIVRIGLIKSEEDPKISILIHDITMRVRSTLAMKEAFVKEKELNLIKSKMITNVSHEFRTPLATIVSSTELLEMQLKKRYHDIDQKLIDLFSNIYEEVDRLSDMMRNFLVLGKIEQNQTPFRPKLVDVLAQTKRIIRTRFVVKYGEDKVVIKVINEPRTVEIDDSLYWHILSNLVSNAIKYSPIDKQVIVELQFLENEFVLVVEDNGIGIPENDIPHIFQSFYRADNSTNQVGDGLGLSIVEKFVKMHNAGIEVKSTLGVGSKFIVHFRYNINHE